MLFHCNPENGYNYNYSYIKLKVAFKIAHPLTYTLCLTIELVTRVTGTLEASRLVDTQLSTAMDTVTLVDI